MKNEIKINNITITYELIRKNVKNLNLRIRSDGSIQLSVHPQVSDGYIEDFMRDRGTWILGNLERIKQRQEHKPERDSKLADNMPEESTIREVFEKTVADMYPKFIPYGVKMPQIKIRTMKSRWGSCSYLKGTITLNRLLISLPRPYLEYVAAHELAHFVHPNHSKAFYNLLDEIMPGHRKSQREMKLISCS